MSDFKAKMHQFRLGLCPDPAVGAYSTPPDSIAGFQVDTDEVSLVASRVHVLDAVQNLGVLFDSQLSMSAQVSAVCCTGYYQLRQLRPLVRCLSENTVKNLIQAFINTRLDYCNSYSRCVDEPPAVSSERCGTSRHQSGSASTLRQSYVSCTGCQSTDAWNSRYPPSSVVRWLALLLCT